jgi:hypothetical protein
MFIRRKVFKISFLILGLLLLVTIFIGKDHPIFYKWLVGSARIVGKPIRAIVYINGMPVTQVKVFETNSFKGIQNSNYLLLDFGEASNTLVRRIICVHKTANYVGEPVGASKKDFDYIAGNLFQSETGSFFVPFESGPKRNCKFDTDLKETDNQVSFNIPKKDDHDCTHSDSISVVQEMIN